MKAAPVDVSNKAIAMLLSLATDSIPHNRKQPHFDTTLSHSTFPFCNSVRRMWKQAHRVFSLFHLHCAVYGEPATG